jgi:hypothetical protein
MAASVITSTAARLTITVALLAWCLTGAAARQPTGTAPGVGQPPSAEADGSPPAESPELRRTFGEPLTAVGPAAPGDTRRLAAAVAAYRSAGDIEAVQPLVAFLREHPDSAWKPSLLANLAVLYRHTGYLDHALEAAAEAWRLTKQSPDPSAKPIADTALATYLELTAALGRTEELAALLAEVRARPMGGHAAEVRSSGWTGLWSMRHDPGGSFRCGPLAVERVSEVVRPGIRIDPRILRYPSTRNGTSLAEIGLLARETGLDFRPVKSSSHLLSGSHLCSLVV